MAGRARLLREGPEIAALAARGELHERADPRRAQAHPRRRRGTQGLGHELADALQGPESVSSAVEGFSSPVHGADGESASRARGRIPTQVSLSSRYHESKVSSPYVVDLPGYI